MHHICYHIYLYQYHVICDITNTLIADFIYIASSYCLVMIHSSCNFKPFVILRILMVFETKEKEEA